MEQSTNTTRKRPVGVWIISILMMASVVLLNLYLVLHLLGVESSPEYVARIEQMTALDYARRVVFGILTLCAAIYLFMLRKIALTFFLALLASGTLLLIYGVIIGAVPEAAVVQAVIAIVISTALPCWYAFRLHRKGVLA